MKKKSKYAEKRERNNMMYGPGCCAHTVTPAQIQEAKRIARYEGRVTRESPYGLQRQEY